MKTTVSDKGAACPLDKVNRQFRAPEPNRLWVADFTYVATWAGGDRAPVGSHVNELRKHDISAGLSLRSRPVQPASSGMLAARLASGISVIPATSPAAATASPVVTPQSTCMAFRKLTISSVGRLPTDP